MQPTRLEDSRAPQVWTFPCSASPGRSIYYNSDYLMPSILLCQRHSGQNNVKSPGLLSIAKAELRPPQSACE